MSYLELCGCYHVHFQVSTHSVSFPVLLSDSHFSSLYGTGNQCYYIQRHSFQKNVSHPAFPGHQMSHYGYITADWGFLDATSPFLFQLTKGNLLEFITETQSTNTKLIKDLNCSFSILGFLESMYFE